MVGGQDDANACGPVAIDEMARFRRICRHAGTSLGLLLQAFLGFACATSAVCSSRKTGKAGNRAMAETEADVGLHDRGLLVEKGMRFWFLPPYATF